MGYCEAHDPHTLEHYEGLVHRTAQQLEEEVELEKEDIEQLLRVKVYKALLKYDPAKKKRGADVHVHNRSCRCRRCKYVFMCLSDQVKDILARKRRGVLSIEDLAGDENPSGGSALYAPETPGRRDRFELENGLTHSHEDVFGEIDDDDFMLPNTLTQLEREIVVRLYRDFNQTEVAEQLGLRRPVMERAVKSIRAKLADWHPDSPSTTQRMEPPVELHTRGTILAEDEAQAA